MIAHALNTFEELAVTRQISALPVPTSEPNTERVSSAWLPITEGHNVSCIGI
jgi:hypothetical protein